MVEEALNIFKKMRENILNEDLVMRKLDASTASCWLKTGADA